MQKEKTFKAIDCLNCLTQTLKTHSQELPWWSSGEDSAPNAGGLGLIPGQGTRSHMLQLRLSTAK